MIKVSIAITLLFLVSGCASPKFNYQPLTRDISEPPLNSIQTAYVGDALVRQGKVTEYEVTSAPGAGTLVKAALADPFKAIQADKNKQELCAVTVFNVAVCEDVEFNRGKKALANSNSFQQTLIYSGGMGNKINVGYREFSSDYARPAFNNNVEYDLKESKVIGYKGAQLKIIEATNQYIKYIVIRNFNTSKN
ncbi:hypothetical protein ACFL4M_00420 [Pseudomonadota bacterium]